MRSHVARCRLAVTYADNPQTDGVDLVGEVEFPNLTLDTTVSAQSPGPPAVGARCA